MGGTFQRNLLLALLAVGALPVIMTMAVTLVVVRRSDLAADTATTILLALGFSLLAATVGLAVGAARGCGAPIHALREGLAMILGPNPRHRLSPPEEHDLAELADGINALAERAARAREDTGEQLAAATRELAFERETLASVLFGLADGVVVCNQDLQIVLSNGAARRMLSRPELPLRRGESIFAYLHAAMLRPLIDPLLGDDAQSAGTRLERGLLSLPDSTVVQVSATAVSDGQGDRHHIFVLRDVTHQVGQEREHDRYMTDAVQRLRSPVTSILSAAEILREYGDLPEPQRRAFLETLGRDAERVADELDALQAVAGGRGARTWAGDEMPIRDLVDRAAAGSAPVLAARRQRVSTDGPDLVVRGDRLSLIGVTRRLLELGADRAPAGGELAVHWRAVSPSLVELAVEMPKAADEGLDEEAIFRASLGEPPHDRSGPASTLYDIVKEHRGELWVRHDTAGAAFVLLLPAGTPDAATDGRTVEPGPGGEAGGDAIGRQILMMLGEGGFFDPRPPAEQLPAHPEARLADLSFVVFDLETTGLDPAGGDEVVSVGAVRVRGGRVVPEDFFFSLVNPGRPIPAASTRIHGITDEMVAGQPPLEEVLPGFFDFVGGSVPTAHVAAFDLAFLNRRLPAAGRPPISPSSVLDTLLLTCSLFPTWNGYNVEEIAHRFDLEVIGRHTSLGDALTTAGILVRLLGVLEQRGVTTLGEALKLQSGDTVRKLVGAIQAELHWG